MLAIANMRRKKYMKPNYKNWMPKGMVCGFLAAAVIAALITVI